ncbi:MAG: protein kinase [Planctomycetota bacterium]
MERVGPYVVQSELARGGMGVVYRAQAADGSPVALKLLLAQRSASPNARRRFLTEVEALARLRHPGVVPVLGAGEHQGVPYMALELVDGESLAARLRRGPLPVFEALRVAGQVAQALSYVHGCGVLHRDLTPGNVLLRRDGQALLTDFGLARDEQAEHSRVTQSGVFLGTPGYWSPEQALGRRGAVGPRTDVYGLGAVLYACLTGRAPVEGGTLSELLIRAEDPPTPPRALRPEVPEWVDALCLRCLARDPEARFASAEAVARALVRGPEVPAERGLGGVALVAVALAALSLSVVVGVAWGRSRPAERAEAPSPSPAEAPPVQDPEPELEAVPGPAPLPGGRSRAFAVAQGLAQLEAKKPEVALAILQQVLELHPEHTPARLGRAEALRELDRWEEALDDYLWVLEQSPRSPVAWAGRGACLHDLGREEEALDALGEAVRLDPSDHRSRTRRATIASKLGRFELAVDELDQLVLQAPDSEVIRGMRATVLATAGRREAALADCDWLLARRPDQRTIRAIRANLLGVLKRYPRALEDYDVLIREAPSAKLHHDRALCRAHLGQHARALADYDAAVALGLDDAAIYANRALARHELEDVAGAVEDFTRALERDPRDATTWRRRALDLNSLDRHPEALGDLERSLELDPGDGGTWVQKGLTLSLLKRYDEAVEALDHALSLELPDPTMARKIRAAAQRAAAQTR